MSNRTLALEDRLLVLKNRVDVLNKAYDPDQPRNEEGRWTAGGWRKFPRWNEATKDVKLFHGTSSKALLRILEKGIKANIPAGGVDRAREEKTFESDSRGATFATVEYPMAAWFSEVVAKHRNAHPVIFKIKVPKESMREAVIDSHEEGMVRFNRDIPPEWIVGFKARTTKGQTKGWVTPDRLIRKSIYGENDIIYVVVDLSQDLEKAYDPKQPRDKDGKWTDEGGGGPEVDRRSFLRGALAVLGNASRVGNVLSNPSLLYPKVAELAAGAYSGVTNFTGSVVSTYTPQSLPNDFGIPINFDNGAPIDWNRVENLLSLLSKKEREKFGEGDFEVYDTMMDKLGPQASYLGQASQALNNRAEEYFFTREGFNTELAGEMFGDKADFNEYMRNPKAWRQKQAAYREQLDREEEEWERGEEEKERQEKEKRRQELERIHREWLWGLNKAYDPNQPRDDDGKWSNVQGGGIVSYHGTTSKTFARVVEQGIKAITNAKGASYGRNVLRQGYVDYYGSDPAGDKQRGKWLETEEGYSYITKDRDSAAEIASLVNQGITYFRSKRRGYQRYGSTSPRPVVFKLRIPKDEFNSKFEPDQFMPDSGFKLKGTIPAKYIEEVSLVDRQGKLQGFRKITKRVEDTNHSVELYVCFVSKEEEELDKAYNPAQPRDSQGQWTDTGGGAGLSAPNVIPNLRHGNWKQSDFNMANIPDMYSEDVDQYNRFAPTIRPTDFKRMWTGGFDASAMRLEKNRAMAAEGRPIFSATAYINDKGGRKLGSMTRHYTEDGEGKVAHHALLTLEPWAQDRGIVKPIIAGQVALYDKMDIDRIELEANIDLGAYAWARYGFLPKSVVDWNYLKEVINNRYDEGKTRGFFGNENDAVISAILKNKDTRGLWATSDLSNPIGNPRNDNLVTGSDDSQVLSWDYNREEYRSVPAQTEYLPNPKKFNTLGKYLLGNATWEGQMGMKTKDQRERFHAYINR